MSIVETAYSISQFIEDVCEVGQAYARLTTDKDRQGLEWFHLLEVGLSLYGDSFPVDDIIEAVGVDTRQETIKRYVWVLSKFEWRHVKAMMGRPRDPKGKMSIHVLDAVVSSGLSYTGQLKEVLRWLRIRNYGDGIYHPADDHKSIENASIKALKKRAHRKGKGEGSPIYYPTVTLSRQRLDQLVTMVGYDDPIAWPENVQAAKVKLQITFVEE